MLALIRRIVCSGQERFGFLLRSLGLVWGQARRWTIAWLVLLTLQGLLPVATVWLTKLLVNGIAAAAGEFRISNLESGADWQRLSPILVTGSLMAAVMLVSELLGGAIQWIRGIQAERLKDHISALIHGQSAAADLAFYESAEFYDHLHRARAEAGHRPLMLLENLGSALQNGITLAAMAAVLLPFGVWLPAALLVSTLPALWVVLRHTVRQHRWWLAATVDERRSWYYDWLLTAGESAAELRLFGLGDHFKSCFQALRRRLRGGELKLARDRTLAELGAGLAGLTITAAALAWMVWKVLLGALTLGDLALFYQAFHQGQGLMRSLLQNVGQIYSNSLFLGNLFEFLALKPKVADPAHPVAFPAAICKGLSFENVSFRYPGSERFALRDFNLDLPAGRITAIVGANGAGKSTLIKLICRFYDPDAGSLRLDGIDLRDFGLQDLRRAATVLFQQPVHYNQTAAENISLGDIRRETARPELEMAAIAAGADEPIAALPRGYDTVLGKWFENGEELSVGEWQRIALARAFLRRAPILLLDEPTSAMDSWAEADWLERIRAHTEGRTVLIITHRFTTAMWADTIHVMSRGRIVESGSHAELTAQGGLYAESWARQISGCAGEDSKFEIRD
jgi:ATP-binding cassette subfamily B protein